MSDETNDEAPTAEPGEQYPGPADRRDRSEGEEQLGSSFQQEQQDAARDRPAGTT